MSILHIYTAEENVLAGYVSEATGCIIVESPYNTRWKCDLCKKRKRAGNLLIWEYYDHWRILCRDCRDGKFRKGKKKK